MPIGLIEPRPADVFPEATEGEEPRRATKRRRPRGNAPARTGNTAESIASDLSETGDRTPASAKAEPWSPMTAAVLLLPAPAAARVPLAIAVLLLPFSAEASACYMLGTNNLAATLCGSSRDRGGISSLWNCWMGRLPGRACFSSVT